MARSNDTVDEINRLHLQQLRDQADQQRFDRMKATGTNASGQPITGWADSRTPIVGPVNGGHVTGGVGLTPDNVWANQFRRHDSQLPAQTTPQATTIPQQVLNTVLPSANLPPFDMSASAYSKPTSLTQMATQMNHEQMWSQPKQQNVTPITQNRNFIANTPKGYDYNLGTGEYVSKSTVGMINGKPETDRLSWASAY